MLGLGLARRGDADKISVARHDDIWRRRGACFERFERGSVRRWPEHFAVNHPHAFYVGGVSVPAGDEILAVNFGKRLAGNRPGGGR